MTNLSPTERQYGLWSYLKLSIKVVLKRPTRFLPLLRDSFRYYIPWKRSLTRNASPLAHRIPWIPFACLDFMERSLAPESVVFEYGSGGSTLYFQERVERLVSVEHDEEWYAAVRRLLDEERVQNCEYFLEVPVMAGEAGGRGLCPFGYDGSGYPGMTFYGYASRIDGYMDKSFDLVMVDGRARKSCLWHARKKVKPGGYLVLDNAEREEYRPALDLFHRWEVREFYGILPYAGDYCRTLVWKRPQDNRSDE